MKRFKHKQTGHIATETHSEKNYKVSYPQNYTIPKWIIENSNDWEEVKPILTTADGVDIFKSKEKVTLYTVWINKSYQDSFKYLQKVKKDFNIEQSFQPNMVDWVWFFDEKKANEYIEKHKPKFSISDIEQAYTWDKTAPLYTQFIDNLKKIVGE